MVPTIAPGSGVCSFCRKKPAATTMEKRTGRGALAMQIVRAALVQYWKPSIVTLV